MTAKEAKFVAEYLVDQNGTQAARRAGYKGTDNALGVKAHELLRKSKIREAVDAGLKHQNDEILCRVQKKVDAMAVTKEQWLERIGAIAFSDMGEAFQPDANGKLTMTIQQMKESGFSKLIRKIKVLPGGKVEVDLHAVLPALELLGKAQGWVKDQVEHSGSIAGAPPISQADAQRIHQDPKLSALARQLAEGLLNPTGTETPAKKEKP